MPKRFYFFVAKTYPAFRLPNPFAVLIAALLAVSFFIARFSFFDFLFFKRRLLAVFGYFATVFFAVFRRFLRF